MYDSSNTGGKHEKCICQHVQPVLGCFRWSDMTMKDETAVIYDEMDPEHFFLFISRGCKIGACISYSLMAFTAFQPEGMPWSSPLISPYRPYIYSIYIFVEQQYIQGKVVSP